MQKNVLESLIKFIVKYIWMICISLILLEGVSVVLEATVLMKQASEGVMNATNGEINGRVETVLKLLKGMAEDDLISDTNQPIFDRAVSTLPYQNSYELYMIAVTDEEGNVVSASETDRNAEPFNLMFRDYMQQLYTTGEIQITDPMVAGADGKTVNYTIAVPIMQQDKVVGSVFGSIYFDDIQEIIVRSSKEKGHSFELYGKENTLISGNDITDREGNIREFFPEDEKGSFWEWESANLRYVLYNKIPATGWMLFYQVDFMAMILPLLPITILKIIFYIVMCAFISVVGKKYLERQLASIRRLLDKMSTMHREIFQTDEADYTTLLDISEKGLSDQLTGLATRTVFFNKIKNWDYENKYGVIMFIDLDDLKKINDTYDHETGDLAILHFATVLKHFETVHNVVTARYGGDEFILLTEASDQKQVIDWAEQLCQSFKKEIHTKDALISIHGSIGIAIYPEDGIKPEDLICKADLALYSAKSKGKGCFSFYEE